MVLATNSSELEGEKPTLTPDPHLEPVIFLVSSEELDQVEANELGGSPPKKAKHRPKKYSKSTPPTVEQRDYERRRLRM